MELSNKNFFMDIKELEAQGVKFITIHTAWEIQCFNKNFTKFAIFAKDSVAKAIKICEECLQSNCAVFITESPSFLTIWKENKQTNLSNNSKESEQLALPAPIVEEKVAQIITKMATANQLGASLDIEEDSKIREMNWWNSYIVA